jgi:cytochrome c oxidase cbb3-type subunit 3
MDAPQLFATFCAQCHGADATGYKSDHAPSLVNPTFLESASDPYLIRSIEQGRPGTAMAAYAKAVGGPLDSQAVAKLVVWLRDKGKPATEPTPPPPGDATRGQPLYVANCLKCHGNESTRGEYVLLGNARFLALASDAFIYHAIVAGRPNTPMEAFDKKLGMQQIADLVAYIRSLAHGAGTTVVPLPAPTGNEPAFINPTGKPPAFAHLKDNRFVPADDVKAALDAKAKLVIIDARPDSEWMTVHVTGAISLPHFAFTTKSAATAKRLAQIPKDATVVAYCACPHHLSGIVVDELVKLGYKHAYVLDEGILEWQRRGYPIVAAQGVTMPPAEPPLPPGTIR